MKTNIILILTCSLCLALQHGTAGEVSFTSPGFGATRISSDGRVLADWGSIELSLIGDSFKKSEVKVAETKLDKIIPAGLAEIDYGAATLILTGYRAPAFPSGVDVLTVQLKGKADAALAGMLQLKLPDNARVGDKTVSIGGRTVMLLPQSAQIDQQTRDWGWSDDAVAMPGWARPEGKCDPAFRNIRAGMEGVPIRYKFRVAPSSDRKVVLGFCESHWTASGSRPVICAVEGAPRQEIDPLTKWGQHKPGVVEFAARDANADGQLEVAVLPKPGAPDLNPILNVLWVFPAEQPLDPAKLISGGMNEKALHYIDVGGANDRSLYAGGNMRFPVTVTKEGTEMVFLSGASSGSVPVPGRNAWTVEKLRKAAADVWKDWPLTAGR